MFAASVQTAEGHLVRECIRSAQSHVTHYHSVLLNRSVAQTPFVGDAPEAWMGKRTPPCCIETGVAQDAEEGIVVEICKQHVDCEDVTMYRNSSHASARTMSSLRKGRRTPSRRSRSLRSCSDRDDIRLVQSFKSDRLRCLVWLRYQSSFLRDTTRAETAWAASFRHIAPNVTFNVVNVSQLSVSMPGAHPPNDCLHYCVPGVTNTWVKLWSNLIIEL